MWMPTHVQVTVQRAADLLTKGKNNTNDCFVTIALGKTKYQTSVKEKAEPSVEWHEECELLIPDQGNTAVIILTVLHRNFLGVDEFLGRVEIPLNQLDVYERPKNRWYTLQSKPGKEGKHKERGKLEVKTAFIVKSGSLTDLTKKDKHKSSIGHLSHLAQSVGGSLLSISSIDKRKGIKKIAKSLGSKMHLKGKKKDVDLDDASSIGSIGSLQRRNDNLNINYKTKQTREDADPGVVSEDEDDFTFDDLSHKSSGSSLNHMVTQTGIVTSTSVTSLENVAPVEAARKNSAGHVAPVKPPRAEQKGQDEWELKLYGKQSKNLLKPNSTESLNKKPWESPKLEAQIEEDEVIEFRVPVTKEDDSFNYANSPVLPKKEEKESMLSKLKKIRKDKLEKFHLNSQERIIIGGETEVKVTGNNKASNEILQKFDGKSREDLILLVCDMQGELEHSRKKMSDLEDYLDELLLRVMETTPRILQIPYVGCKMGNTKLI
ncbi:hypothetical protein PPYR_05444 [Photinus pyralis]|uniref:Uncharacterized protein n=1 Tax=Photinus pyralis TaxID=7054 RepID=A0A1Y1LJX8_PHOPY|nr:rab11 family-interacting protein 2 [Photinus pyralis]KAB0801090.1 hypothetical protein PPYR_05444 [Photinus pyralis]